MKHYETSAGLPTRGLTYAKMLDHLRETEELMILMAHLVKAEGTLADEALANGWLLMAQMHEKIRHKVTEMAQGRLN